MLSYTTVIVFVNGSACILYDSLILSWILVVGRGAVVVVERKKKISKKNQ